jgi:hypothetical protein
VGCCGGVAGGGVGSDEVDDAVGPVGVGSFAAAVGAGSFEGGVGVAGDLGFDLGADLGAVAHLEVPAALGVEPRPHVPVT